MYKKNLSTPDLHLRCNLTSDNMPKIQPQTKVLFIKSLKTKSAALVADLINASKHRVERIKKDLKKLVTFMTNPGQADPVRQLFERTVCCFGSPGPARFQLQQSHMRTGHQKPLYLQEQFVKFSHTVVSMIELLLTNQH